MRFKAATVFALAAIFASPLFAQEAAEAPQEDPALEGEISFVEALVTYGYPDIATPVIEETKKKWPASEARFFAIEIRSMLALGKFEEAEKKIAALPDRKSTKFWAARLEVALNYFSRGQKAECMKIYEEFFKVFAKPPAEIRKFYMEACYTYGQLLAQDKQYAKAAQRYEALLKQLKQGDDDWCNLGCETVELYLKVADTLADPKKKKEREAALKAATVIVDKLLWQLEKPVYFGRAVSMKAHIEQMRGDITKASDIIEEYKPQLQELHDQIVQYDPDGKQGLLKQSPLPECLYLQAKMLWDEARAEYKKPAKNKDRILALLLGPKPKEGGRRDTSKGAFGMATLVFLKYDTSSWAANAGELSTEVCNFVNATYGNGKVVVRAKITAEQIAKVRAAQFREAAEKMNEGRYEDAIEAYFAVLAKYPELAESVAAIESVASAYIDLSLQVKDANQKVDYRQNAEAIEGYLAERFAGSKDKVVMTTAGDAALRLAAREVELKNVAWADSLYEEFCRNYTRHPAAANMAASRANEKQKAENYEGALRFWGIIAQSYTNSSVYAVSLAKISECYGKLGDVKAEIEWKNKYLGVETVKIRQLQAKFQLAQLYQRNGLDILAACATNENAEVVEAEERRGTAQIVRAIKEFSGFAAAADAALKDPATNADDAGKYKELREGAMFMVGECWSRMKRPEKNLAAYRDRAAKGYEAYLAAYPEGKWAKGGYVKLGTIYTAMGDMEKSKDALDRLSKKFPDSEEAKNAKPRLAKNLIEMGMKKEGTEIYAEMLRTEGGAYTAGQFLSAGEALIEAKSWDYANQAFAKAIRLAATNQTTIVAKARLGEAKCAWRQGSLPEAREALDQFLADKKMSSMAIAADAHFMLVEIASQQGRMEKDAALRGKHFGAAIGSLKKVRQYWKNKPQWEQDQLDLLSGDVLIDRMKAEEAMGLKEEARETCGKAAATFQVFLQAHGPTEAVPFDKMDPGQVRNLERAYATMVPLFAKMGADQADRVMKFGQQYLDLFPEGKARTEIVNCMNQAKADLPAEAAKQQ